MKVQEYLSSLKPSTKVTFIKARARKDANTPFYHAEYQTTPLNMSINWKGEILDYIILNHKQPPIVWLSGAGWQSGYRTGAFKSLLIISEEDFKLLYPSEEQRASMIAFIDRLITGGEYKRKEKK